MRLPSALLITSVHLRPRHVGQQSDPKSRSYIVLHRSTDYSICVDFNLGFPSATATGLASFLLTTETSLAPSHIGSSLDRLAYYLTSR